MLSVLCYSDYYFSLLCGQCLLEKNEFSIYIIWACLPYRFALI